MSDEHMAMAREITRDWTSQTTLADSRRDIANALAAAEERGRRSAETERDELRMALAALAERAGGLLRLTKGEMEAVDRRAVLETVPQIGGGLLVRVLAPRDSAPVCDNCKRAATAKDGRTEHGIEIGPCYCVTLRAPRDSGKEG